jgi:hypothetical protein
MQSHTEWIGVFSKGNFNPFFLFCFFFLFILFYFYFFFFFIFILFIFFSDVQFHGHFPMPNANEYSLPRSFRERIKTDEDFEKESAGEGPPPSVPLNKKQHPRFFLLFSFFFFFFKKNFFYCLVFFFYFSLSFYLFKRNRTVPSENRVAVEHRGPGGLLAPGEPPVSSSDEHARLHLLFL